MLLAVTLVTCVVIACVVAGQEVALERPVCYRGTQVLAHDHRVPIVEADPDTRVYDLAIELLHRGEVPRRGQRRSATLRAEDGDVNRVGAERVCQHLRQRARHTTMLGWVLGVVRRGDERAPGGVDRRAVVPDRGDWAPEQVVVLRVEEVDP